MKRGLTLIFAVLILNTNSQVLQKTFEDSLKSHHELISNLNKEVFPKTPSKADAIIRELLIIDNNTHNALSAPNNLLVSRVGLNNFFAKKIGYFLTGNENPSLHRNYLFLDIGENDLVFGHNRYFTRDNKRVMSVLTYGLKADLEDDFAELINEDGLKGNFGANLKYTFYFTGGVKYDDLTEWQKTIRLLSTAGTQKCDMDNKRRLFLTEQIRKLKQESIDHEKSEEAYLKDDSRDHCDAKKAYLKEASDEYYEELKRKYFEAYYDKEAELLDEWDAKNLVRVSWISFSGFFPFTSKTYSVITNTTELPHEKKSYLTNGSLNYYYLIEHKRTGKWLINLGATAEYNNSVKNEEMDKYTINELKTLGLHDSVYIHQKEGDIYYGAYQEYISGKLIGQATYFPKKKESKFFTGDWGVSVRYEYAFDGLNDKVNLRFGLPFLLKGKDEDNPVNFEVQFKCNDVNRWTSNSKKYSVGISVGLPFSSILYKED